MSRRVSLFATLVALSSGCSVVVGGTEPPTCDRNDECQILNQLDGIGDAACERYQCDVDTSRCVLGARDADRDGQVAAECADSPLAAGRPIDCNDDAAGGQERCNGRDDDCDGVIDEGTMVDEARVDPLPAGEAAELIMIASTSGAGAVGYGDGSGALAVAYTEDDNATFSVLGQGEAAIDAVALSHVRTTDLANTSESALEAGCHTFNPAGAVGVGVCNFSDLDVSPTTSAIFAAAVSRTGCGDGQLRVGIIDPNRPGELIERGPARRSNVFAGVDVVTQDGMAVCTGASRAGAQRGVARPSVAAMNIADREQALVAVIADEASRDACGGTAADVEVLGLHVMEHTFGAPYRWITGSNEGVPQVVGTTDAGGRPGIGVWDSTGYLVAFGNGNQVQLVFVDRMAEPPAYDASGAPDDRSGQETGPLTVTDLGAFDAGGPVDDVVVTFGSIRVGGIEVGLAWREGCGSEAQGVGFRQIFLAREGDVVTVDEGRSQPVQPIASGVMELSPPAIAYTFDGLLQPGVSRPDGRPMGTDQNEGGWFVSWASTEGMDPGPADDRRVFAVRMSEADGIQLEDALFPLNLSPSTDQRRVSPFLFRDGSDIVRYGFLSIGEATSFRGAALSCSME